jgi:hypothetical protein
MERPDIALGSIGAIGGDCLESKWHLHVGQSADLKSGPGNDDLRRERRFSLPIGLLARRSFTTNVLTFFSLSAKHDCIRYGWSRTESQFKAVHMHTVSIFLRR